MGVKMKKNYIWCGFVYVLVGLIFAFFSVKLDGKIGSLLAGFSGGGIGAGLMMIGKYLYWNNPVRLEQYKVKLEEEEIELKDERNEMYRDKAGRYTYQIGMIIIPISIMIFSILNALEVYTSTVIMIYLTFLWIFLYVVGIFFYKKLKKDE